MKPYKSRATNFSNYLLAINVEICLKEPCFPEKIVRSYLVYGFFVMQPPPAKFHARRNFLPLLFQLSHLTLAHILSRGIFTFFSHENSRRKRTPRYILCTAAYIITADCGEPTSKYSQLARCYSWNFSKYSSRSRVEIFCASLSLSSYSQNCTFFFS